MKKVFIALVIVSLLVCTALAAPAANPTVRVGLFFGNDALVSANLQNITGHGYRFGFFDDNRNFSELLYLDATNRITMACDLNLYFHDGAFYTSGAPAGSKLIGAYHLQPDKVYETANEAVAAAASLQMQGTPAIPAYVNGVFKLRIGFFTDINSASAAKSKYSGFGNPIVVGAGPTCITVINTANGSVLFEYDNAERPLGVYPSKGDVAMPLTWFKGYKYHGGFQYIRNGGKITVINFVPMQEYVMGVVPYEMPPAWPLEALKAQAMCARTYSYYNFGKHGSAFDVCNTTDCQVYRGANSATENSDNAVRETYGKYILYDGKPINAVFHSSNGGATEDASNVWWNDIPYLKGKKDTYEDLDNAINGRWSYEYTSAEITQILNAKGHKCGKIVDAFVEQYTPMGNVYKVSFIDENGKILSFTRENARLILNSSTYNKYTHSLRYSITRGGLPSAGGLLYINSASNGVNPYKSGLFVKGAGGVSPLPDKPLTVLTASGRNKFGDADTGGKASDGFLVSGTGWGHNVGLSQNGAKGMANRGFTADEIISFYYTGVEIFNAA
jgi:stage II sporulation protein D